jgi:hypothetical protein
MTHRELQILAARERVTLRQRRRGTRRYWDICARHHGELSTLYLCTDSALATLSEEEFLRRVRSLPGRGDAAELVIAYLPGGVVRHWLLLAVATLWVLGCGTRADDAETLGVAPERVRVPPDLPTPTRQPVVGLFQRGLSWARRQLGYGRIWQRLWLRPSALPGPYPGVHVTIHRYPISDILLE